MQFDATEHARMAREQARALHVEADQLLRQFRARLSENDRLIMRAIAAGVRPEAQEGHADV